MFRIERHVGADAARGLVALVALAAASGHSASAHAGAASEVVASLYDSVGMEADIALRDFYTDPALTRLNQNDAAFDRGGERCIDFGIAVDGQDFDADEIARTLDLSEEGEDDRTRVVASFSNFGQATRIEWTLELVGGEWKVADVASPQGGWRLSQFDCE